MIRQEKPRALVILAHYLVFLKYLPDTWLYQGVASHGIAVLVDTVDTSWRQYLSLPEKALRMEDKSAVAELLANGPPGHAVDKVPR